ncbi:PKD domain-containing protein [Candidatus Bipolaricaulota bacterium]
MGRIAVHQTAPQLGLLARFGAVVCLLGGVAVLLWGCFLIPNLPPTARTLADVLAGQPPLSIQFDGTTSDDEDGIVSAYRWSFGDGAISETMQPTHTYTLPGEYSVTLTVTDNDGASSATTRTVIVTKPNVPPVANFTATPSAVVPGETIQFDAAGSLDGDGWLVSQQWDFGDGTSASGSTVEHQYSTPGTYPVALTVVDNDDAVGTHRWELLVVDTNQAPQPQLELSATALDPGETLVCSAAGSVDPDGEIVAFEWTFGDGTQAEGSTTTHVYSTAGTYRVMLTATDNQGAKQGAERTITVGSPSDPPAPPPADGISCSFSWSYGGIRSLSIAVPESLYEYYQSQPRGVWATDGYSRFVLDAQDDSLMLELRSALLLNNSYQATIENALAFVQKAVDYQLDPAGAEYPRYPVETLVEGVGDCEDSAILYASIVRTFGYNAGVLLVSVDTDGDQLSDHVVVFVRVADCFIEAHPERSLWDISGKTYAFAETAVSGGYVALGVDPWGIEQEDIQHIWDVAGSSKSLQATRRQFP